MHTPFSVHQRNLGAIRAAYSMEYDAIVRQVNERVGDLGKSRRLVETTFADLMRLLEKSPHEKFEGEPRAFVRKLITVSALDRAGNQHRMRRNPDGEDEIEGYSFKELKPMIKDALRKNISVLVRGSPGLGKSSMAQELADEFNLPLIDIRLAQKDPTELGGIYFPIVDANNKEDYGKMRLFPPDWAIRASQAPAFIFLDEINAATSKAQQAAAYQIVLERRVGNTKFHPDTVVMAAGNLASDQAIVTPLSSALNNRFLHFVLKPDLASWLEWANRINLKTRQPNIDPLIVDYFTMVESAEPGKGVEALYKNDGRYVAFPSPRSWEIVSKILQMLPKQPNETQRKQEGIMLTGAIGPEAAGKFLAFLNFRRQFDPGRVLDRGLPPVAFERDYVAKSGEMDGTQQRFASMSGLTDHLFMHELTPQQVRNLAEVLSLLTSGGSGKDGKEYEAGNEYVTMLVDALWRSSRQDLVTGLCQTDAMKRVAANTVSFNLGDANSNPYRRRMRRR